MNSVIHKLIFIFIIIGFATVAGIESLKGQTDTIIYQENFEEPEFSNYTSNPNVYGVEIDPVSPTLGWLVNDNSINGFLNFLYDDCGERHRVDWSLSNAWTTIPGYNNKIYQPISGNNSLGISALAGPGNNPQDLYFYVDYEYYDFFGFFICPAIIAGVDNFWSTNMFANTDRWAYNNISTAGYKNITLDFDWECSSGFPDHFYGMVGYSTGTDTAFTWLTTGGDGTGKYWNSDSPSHQQLILPSTCDNNPNFVLAFKFFADASFSIPAFTLGPSFVIDNIVISANAFNFVCAVPANFKAVIGNPANGLNHYIDLSWVGVDGAEGYQLDDSISRGFWQNIFEGNATSYNHNTGDNPNEQYFYRIRAYDAGNYCNYTYTSRYTACNNPNLAVFNPQTNSLQLTLNPESPAPNPSYTEYSIFMPDSNKYLQANGTFATVAFYQSMAAWDTVTINNLTPNTQYCFVATAQNMEGDLRSESQVCATTLAEPFSCVTPKNLKAVIGVPANGTSYHLYITWSKVYQAQGYELQDSVEGGNWSTLTETSNTYFDHNCGENPNVPFWYRVRAYNGASNCNYSQAVRRYTACANPDINTGLATTSSIDLLLTPESPVSNPSYTTYSIKVTGSQLTGINFVQANDSLASDTIYQNMTTWGNTIPVSGLKNAGGTYCFIAYARNGDGYLSISGEVCASTNGCQEVSILQGLGSPSACTGSADTLKIKFDGTLPVTYQLYKQGTTSAIEQGETNTNIITYPIKQISLLSAGQYKYVLTGCNDVSKADSAYLTVYKTIANVSYIRDTAICTGSALNFTVSATGKTPISYQWERVTAAGAVAVAGATASTYNLSAVTAADSGKYYCELSNVCGSVETDTADFGVNGPPVIVSQPNANVTGCAGTEISLTVQTSGSAPMKYQWSYNGNAIPSATNSTYTLGNPSLSNGGNYSCSISNSCNSIKSGITYLSFNSPVTVVSEPGSYVSECAGNNYTFIVDANGTGPITYQWEMNGSPIKGATGSSYTLLNISTLNTGKYFQCKMTNICGTETTTGTILIADIPAIVSAISPNEQVCPGDSANIAITNIGTEPVRYKWWKLISGEWKQQTADTTNQIKISDMGVSDTGMYICSISNSCGQDTSNAIHLSLNQSINIITQPATVAVCSGSGSTMTVNASGTAPVYQWYLNNIFIPGATKSSYAIASASTSNTGNYTCIIHNGCGTVTSNQGSLSLIPNLQIETNSVTSKSKCPGDSAMFTVDVSDPTGVSYQWKKNSIAIAGATNSVYDIDTLRPTDAGTYRCIVQNECIKDSITCSLGVDQTVTIYTQPVSQKVCENASNVTFSVTAKGSLPFIYQWIKNGTIVGTNSLYVITSAKASDAGSYYCNVFSTSSGCGYVKTNVVSLVVNQALKVATEPLPTNRTECSGLKMSYKVLLTDSQNVSYQWYKFISGSWTKQPGATKSSYILTNLAVANAGIYRCTMNNACSTLNTVPDTLSIKQSPVILGQKGNLQTLCQGKISEMIITSTEGDSLKYQWEKGLYDIAGSTNATFIIYPTKTSDAGNYYCVVYNSCGYDTSNVFNLVINTNVSVATNPVSQSKCIGNKALLSVAPSDSTSVTYKWLYNGSIVPGFSTRYFKIDSAQFSNDGNYKCVIANTCNTVTSTQATLTVYQKPAIVSMTGYITRCTGDSATLSVDATGTDLVYTWIKNNDTLYGATSSVVTLNQLSENDEALYMCNVSNICSTVSKSTILIVNSAPIINVVPITQYKSVGDSVRLTLSPGGSSPFTFQWFINGNIISGATNNSYVIDSLIVANTGIYTCIVTNSCGTTTSTITSLVVTENTGIKIQGYLTYDNTPNSPISMTKVYLYTTEMTLKDSSITDTTGFFRFIQLSRGKYFVVPDILKKWGGATPVDALLVNRYYLRSYQFGDALKKQAGDVNLDGKINPVDGLLINRRYIKAISSFKAGNWIYQQDTITITGSNVTYNFNAICVGDVNGSYTPSNGLFFFDNFIKDILDK